ncbi:MAG: hypothetical protein HYZ53_20100 [Planctomycetes bacterium]|nr:hypothetical protein [Planctomycetota bacterium]
MGMWMRRRESGRRGRPAVAILVALLFSGAETGAQESAPTAAAARRAAAWGNAQGRLARVPITRTFRDTPLPEAVATIGGDSGVHLRLHERVLARCRGDALRVSARLAGVPAGLALGRILQPLGLALSIDDVGELVVEPDGEGADAAGEGEGGELSAADLAALGRVPISLSFTDAPLADVVAFLREFARMNLVVDERVWQKLGPEERKVSLKLDAVPLSTALRLILTPRKLALTREEGCYLIVPADALEERLVLRLHDLRDLLYSVPDFQAPDLSLLPDGAGVAEAGGGEAAGAAADPQALVDLIKRSSGGDTWQRVRGTSITLSNGILFVVQSAKVQRRVSELVAKLRETR